MKLVLRTLFVLSCILFSFSVSADTLKLSLKQADSIFVNGNSRLIAAKLNIERQSAFVIQSKVYPNPVISAEFNIYDPENNKTLHIGETGEKIVQVEQLILLGGKRKAEVELAKTNVQLAELEYENILREIRYELHASLFIIHQQLYLITKFDSQLKLLENIIQSYDIQAKKGNIPLKDAIRLRSVYLNLNGQRSDIYNIYYEQMSKVQLILGKRSLVELRFEDISFDKLEKDISLSEILNTAFNKRPDYRIEEKNKELAALYLNYQKKLAVPDINIYGAYDQRGGAFVNQWNGGISIPLPLWNRNKGNIMAAKVATQMADYSFTGMRQKIENELQLGFNKYRLAVNDYNKSRDFYSEDFDEAVRGITTNFQKRNITMIEFVDFFESYSNALSELARTRVQLAVSAHQINYLTASEIFINE